MWSMVVSVHVWLTCSCWPLIRHRHTLYVLSVVVFLLKCFCLFFLCSKAGQGEGEPRKDQVKIQLLVFFFYRDISIICPFFLSVFHVFPVWVENGKGVFDPCKYQKGFFVLYSEALRGLMWRKPQTEIWSRAEEILSHIRRRDSKSAAELLDTRDIQKRWSDEFDISVILFKSRNALVNVSFP